MARGRTAYSHKAGAPYFVVKNLRRMSMSEVKQWSRPCPIQRAETAKLVREGSGFLWT